MVPAEMSLRVARSQHDALRILDVLKEMHAEVGRAPLDDQRSLANIWSIVQDGHARVVEVLDEIVATYGLVRSQWWYSQEEAFFSHWLFITKEYRNTRAGRLLLEDICDLVEVEQVPAYVHIYEASPNISRKTRLRIIGEELGFMPSGRVMLVEPKGE